jgi:hypothetical protein
LEDNCDPTDPAWAPQGCFREEESLARAEAELPVAGPNLVRQPAFSPPVARRSCRILSPPASSFDRSEVARPRRRTRSDRGVPARARRDRRARGDDRAGGFRRSTSGDLTDPFYLASRANCVQLSRAQGIDAVLQTGVDAIVAPSYSFASTPAAVAG